LLVLKKQNLTLSFWKSFFASFILWLDTACIIPWWNGALMDVLVRFDLKVWTNLKSLAWYGKDHPFCVLCLPSVQFFCFCDLLSCQRRVENFFCLRLEHLLIHPPFFVSLLFSSCCCCLLLVYFALVVVMVLFLGANGYILLCKGKLFQSVYQNDTKSWITICRTSSYATETGSGCCHGRSSRRKLKKNKTKRNLFPLPYKKHQISIMMGIILLWWWHKNIEIYSSPWHIFCFRFVEVGNDPTQLKQPWKCLRSFYLRLHGQLSTLVSVTS
jgi:hypothetical protein